MQISMVRLSFATGSLYTSLIPTEPLVSPERVWRNEANTMVALHKESSRGDVL